MSAFELRHVVVRLAERFLRTEDLPRDVKRAGGVSSAAPDESSPPGNYTPSILRNSPTREIGNPNKMRKKVRHTYSCVEFDETYKFSYFLIFLVKVYRGYHIYFVHHD